MSFDKSAIELEEEELNFRYSKIFADGVGAQDINLAEGGGSNDRAFRKIYEWIQENPKKVKHSLFLIGFTSLHRQDLYFDYEKKRVKYSLLGDNELNGIYKDIDSKMLKTWDKVRFKYFYNEDIEREQLVMNAELLQTYIESKNSKINYFYALITPEDYKWGRAPEDRDKSHYNDKRLNWYRPGGYDTWPDYIESCGRTPGGHPRKEEHIKLGKDLIKNYG